MFWILLDSELMLALSTLRLSWLRWLAYQFDESHQFLLGFKCKRISCSVQLREEENQEDHGD